MKIFNTMHRFLYFTQHQTIMLFLDQLAPSLLVWQRLEFVMYILSLLMKIATMEHSYHSHHMRETYLQRIKNFIACKWAHCTQDDEKNGALYTRPIADHYGMCTL